MTDARKRLAIIDDHHLVLDGLSTWFAANAPEFDLVISASAWAALIRHPEFPPDVILMDYQLVEPISIESRIGLCKAAGAEVVVMSAVTDAAEVTRILQAGAAGFVSKSQPAADLLAAVRKAVAEPPAWEYTPAWGEPSASRDERSSAPSRRASASPPRFSAEDIAILNLYADGHNPVEVALLQNIRAETVRKTLERIRAAYEAVGRPADDRETLIRRAAEDGYLA